MSLLALALLARVATTPPPPPVPPPQPRISPIPSPDRPLGPDVGVGTDELGEEIVIIARKLRTVHVNILRTSLSGSSNCTVLRSSGDLEVDTISCEAAKACAVKLPNPRTPIEQMIQCTRDEQARRVEQLAEKRIEEEYRQ